MTTDVYVREIEDAWPEATSDAWEVLEPVRQQWRDEDRHVELEDDHRDEAA